jgi:hypothetical protein
VVYGPSNQCPPTPEPDPLVLGTGNWGLTVGPRRGVWCGGPAASIQYIVSLVQWVTVCFPPRRTAIRIPRMLPHLQWNRVLLLAMFRYIGDPT